MENKRIPNHKIEIELTPKIYKLLETLVASELYGYSDKEVVKTIFNRYLEGCIMDGTINTLSELIDKNKLGF